MGHSLTKKNATYKIREILADHVQIILEEHPDKIEWLQDFDWHPTTAIFNATLASLGFVDCGDCLRLNNHFYPKPQTIPEFADLIQSARINLLNQAKDFPKQA